LFTKNVNNNIFTYAPFLRPLNVTQYSISALKEYVVIGTQKWTNRNLNVSTYRNGVTIPQVTDPTTWAGLTTGAWCYYNNDPTTEATYGKLYNWYAVNDSRGLAPTVGVAVADQVPVILVNLNFLTPNGAIPVLVKS